ncbi:MAG: glycosyltransferase [Endomicrobiales bacterium]|nr:glycosyltransferase [Endomicrobiales bacterium]
MTENPFISVIVPTFNRKDMLRQCLNSIFAQTYSNFELIIVDNMSTDGTEEYVRNIPDKRIKYFRNPNNGVIAVNRNFGMHNAIGKFIAFCDDDDLWLPYKLEKQMAIFKQYNNLQLVSSNAISFKDNKLVKLMSRQTNDITLNIKILLQNNLIYNSTVLFKKDVITTIGYINENANICGAEDYDFWLHIAKSLENSIYVIAEPLILYRMHLKNFSDYNLDKDIDKLKLILEKHTDVESTERININIENKRNLLLLWYKLYELDFKKTGIINFLFSKTSFVIKTRVLFYYLRGTITKVLGIYSYSIKNKPVIQKYLDSTL